MHGPFRIGTDHDDTATTGAFGTLAFGVGLDVLIAKLRKKEVASLIVSQFAGVIGAASELAERIKRVGSRAATGTLLKSVLCHQ